MSQFPVLHGLRIHPMFHQLIDEEITPGTSISTDFFFQTLAHLVERYTAEHVKLLQLRDQYQDQIHRWLAPTPNNERPSRSPAETEAFLRQIGYLLPEVETFQIGTSGVDPEIASVAGPQLVVPVNNARYALNAANARWKSLYDAFYGTDVVEDTGPLARGSKFNQARAERVFEEVARLLDRFCPLQQGSHNDIQEIRLESASTPSARLLFLLKDGQTTELIDANQWRGLQKEGDTNRPSAVLLRQNGLHFEIQIDPHHPVGACHQAGIKDVLAEAALTTIQDFEDSVAAVDAEDKVLVYRNWSQLMRGNLSCTFLKEGRKVNRYLASDREYEAPDGVPFSLPGRSLLLARNVGIHMFTDTVTLEDGSEIPEGILDLLVTALAATHDLKGSGALRNSRTGSIYVVKPKMHGPDEVALNIRLFTEVENALDLPPNTLKIGIMDEERRTTVNLKTCIQAAQDRIVFINTGFLDRTGDEIHTSMDAGPMLPKPEIKREPFMTAYEDWNVDVGLECGFPHRAQIGKGMWAMPDEMKAMLETKDDHPRAGANCAWVPSPTGATLHALHYHEVDVFARQEELAGRTRASLADILTPPLLPAGRQLTPSEVQCELENNIQGILGYVVRWIDQGIGCSKIPDIHNTGLMEDRATLRISSQHVANWLYHGIVKTEQVEDTLRQVAAIVDQQNAGDPQYRPMAPNFDNNCAFQAARELIFNGQSVANGYTEPTLHKWRREAKRRSPSKT